MQMYHRIIVCCFCIFSIYTLDAQIGIAIDQTSKHPVLVDDHLSRSLKLARNHFDQQRIDSCSVWKSLSRKQKYNIDLIEFKRDNRLNQLDLKISAKNEELQASELSSNKDLKVIEVLKNELSILALERQCALAESKDQIRAQLTKKQRKVYDKCK